MSGIIGGVGDFLFGSGGSDAQPFRAPGFQQQGELLNQLFTGQVLGQAPQLQQGFPDISPIQPQDFNLPELNFSQRTPFQFSGGYNPNTAVADAFTPQAQALEALSSQRGQLQDQATLDDLNRRGLLTAGATTEQLDLNQQNREFALNQALGALAGQQAQTQTQAGQFGAQLDAQRQAQQAAEIFRQQGATDQQAIALANQALQNASFTNQSQQQPINNLLRLYGLSSGGTPATQAQPGFVQKVAPAAISALTGGIF